MAYRTNPEYQEDLPELQKRKRRAAALRKRQQGLEAMGNSNPELGSVTKGSRGSLYDIQGTYIPNYAGQIQKAVGALGSIWADKQADKAEDEYNAMANPYQAEIAGQIGQDFDPTAPVTPPDTSTEMAKTLGVQPGKEFGQGPTPQAGAEVMMTDEDLAVMTPEQQAETKTTLASLNRMGQQEAAQQYLDKARKMAGPQSQQAQQVANQQTDMGGGMGQDPFAKASPGNVSAGSSGPEAGLSTFSDPTGAITPQKRMQMERTLAGMRAKGASDQEIEDYMVRSFAEAEAEATGTHSMVPGSLSMGAVTESPMDESEAGPVEAEVAKTLGLAPKGKKRNPLAPTDAQLRLYFQLSQGKEADLKDLGIGGDRKLFKTEEDSEGNIHQIYNDGSTQILPFKARPKGVRFMYDDYEKKWYQYDPTSGYKEVPPADVPNNVPQTTLKGEPMTVQQVQAAIGGAATARPAGASPGAKFSEAEVAAQKAPVEIDTANQKEANKMALERQNAARNALSKMDLTSNPGADAATNLLKHPGLKRITAGTWGSYADAIGRKDEKGGYPFFGIGALARPALAQKDPEAADALALIDQVRSSAFATGFQALVGQGAGSISDAEGQGIARALANLETARTTPALEQALKDYIKLKSTIEARWRREAAGEGAAPAQGGGKYSNMSDDDLLKSLIPGG